MQLFLTSAWLSNPSLIQTTRELVPGEIRTAYIPTAANVEEWDKSWLIDNLQEFADIGSIDIVDIAALPQEIWLPRLQQANIIAVGWGNTSHLMQQIIASWLVHVLPRLIESRLYIGISAGSIVACRSLWCSSEFLFGDEIGEPPAGLWLTDISFRPHYLSPHFSRVNDEQLSQIAAENPGETIYALDDASGILITETELQVISEGKRKVFDNR